MSDRATNRQLAKKSLQRFRDNTTGHYINDQWALPESHETFANLSPHEQSHLDEVSDVGNGAY